MAKLLKKVKLEQIYFENIDILKYLEKIMETNTKYNTTDFEYDKALLRRAKQGDVYLWLSFPNGTQCLREKEVFLKHTCQHKIYVYDICTGYLNAENRVLLYAVEIEKIENEKVIGKLYQLDYWKHIEHVKEVSIIGNLDDTKYIIEIEGRNRDKFLLEDIKQHIERLCQLFTT